MDAANIRRRCVVAILLLAGVPVSFAFPAAAAVSAFSPTTPTCNRPVLNNGCYFSTSVEKAGAFAKRTNSPPNVIVAALSRDDDAAAGTIATGTTGTATPPPPPPPSEPPTTTATTTTTQDEKINDPASIVYYDDVLDDSKPAGVVCARGVCVLEEDFDDDFFGAGIDSSEPQQSLVEGFLSSYLGPRILLFGASVLYGTNFPLGAVMNEALPPSAATSARMVLASLALSPFLPRLDPVLSRQALLCGCFTALGYTTQSLALVDVSPATVAFLGAATVVVCPTLEALVDKTPMGVRDAPQTWLAAALCLTGVGILELCDPTVSGLPGLGWGDALALLQAVGFGTSFFLTERMMRGRPDQALPITAVQVSTTALICMLWSFSDGWIGQPGSESFGLPNLFFEPSLQLAAGAVVWTGLITTAMNRFVETTALGKTSSAEASVILATEPLWAALFAAWWLSDSFGWNDYVGGALIVAACVANSLKPSDFDRFFPAPDERTTQ